MAFDIHAVGGAQIACDDGVAVVGDVDLHVAAGDARIVDHDIAVGSAADDGLAFREQILVFADFQHRAVFGLRVGGDGHGIALHGFARQLEIALGEVKVLFEDHHDRTDERVMLVLRVLGEVVGQLIGQRFRAPFDDVVEIRRAQLETVLIRRHGTVSRDGHGLFVNLTFQSAGKVDGLQVLGPELGENPVDGAFHAFLKSVENTHACPFLSSPILRGRAPSANS